ncbi:unnamed protein product, partial [Medioppia subpectinata]
MSAKKGYSQSGSYSGDGGGGRSGGSGGNMCFNCGKSGHMSRECPEPDKRRTGSGGRSGGDGSGGNRRQVTCHKCGQLGHISPQCPQQRAGGDRRGDHSTSTRGAGDCHRALPFTSGRPTQPPQQQQQQQRSPRSKEIPYIPDERPSKASAQFVRRPDTGAKGTRIQLIANHFRLIIEDIVVNHYHVEFECGARTLGQAVASGGGDAGADRESKNKVRKLRQKENRQVFREFMSNQPQLFRDPQTGDQLLPVFDGNSNFYTKGRLSQDENTCTIQVAIDGSNPVNVNVTIKYTQPIDLSTINLYYDGQSDTVPREAMQALDIILRYGPTSDRIPIGNSLYPKWDESNPMYARVNIDNAGPDSVGYKQVVFGHYQSTRLTKIGPTILVDRSATAFFTGGSLMDFMYKMKRQLEQRMRNASETKLFEILAKECKGLRVYTHHLSYRRSYTIKDLSRFPPDRQTFEIDENGRKRQVSVKDYFKSQYKKDITDTGLPCLIPQANKPIYLPIEMCTLHPDQPVSRAKLDPFSTSKMVRACGSQSPVERFDAIEEAVRTINETSAPYLNEFSLSIDTRPVQVPGRVLTKPDIKGLDRDANKTMHNPIPLERWVCVNLCAYNVSREAYDSFIRGLMGKYAHDVGMTVSRPAKLWEYDRQTPSDIAEMFRCAKQDCPRLQMIMFIIHDTDDLIHANIKFEAECHQGIVTQCVLAKNVKTPKGGLQSNLLLKINTKLGGVNRILESNVEKPEVLRKDNYRVMFIGADVTHPAPADKLETSVAACVGSIDTDYCTYSASIRAQERTTKAQAVEMIKDFDGMIAELLAEYKGAQKGFPNHIIYY